MRSFESLSVALASPAAAEAVTGGAAFAWPGRSSEAAALCGSALPVPPCSSHRRGLSFALFSSSGDCLYYTPLYIILYYPMPYYAILCCLILSCIRPDLRALEVLMPQCKSESHVLMEAPIQKPPPPPKHLESRVRFAWQASPTSPDTTWDLA